MCEIIEVDGFMWTRVCIGSKVVWMTCKSNGNVVVADVLPGSSRFINTAELTLDIEYGLVVRVDERAARDQSPVVEVK